MSLSWIVQGLRAIVADLTDECSGSGITQAVAEGRIEMMYRDLLAKELVRGLCTQKTELSYTYLKLTMLSVSCVT